MPDVKDFEKEDDWMGECVPIRVKEGDEQKQAVAVCLQMWRDRDKEKPEPEKEGPPWAKRSIPELGSDGLVSFGEPLKALSEEAGQLRVGAYGIRYGSPSETDAVGDWFAPDTDYGPNDGGGRPTMFHHGLPIRPELAHLAAKMFSPVEVKRDDVGLFVQTALNMADEYEAAIGALVKAGKLRWSSGTASHLIVRDNDTGKLLRWHPVEWSYTPKAAEPRLPTIAPLKALQDATYADLEAPPQATVTETVAADAGHVSVDVHVHLHDGAKAAPLTTGTESPTTEVLTMDEKEKETPTVDVGAIAREAATAAVKAYQDEMAKQPATKTAGFSVTGDSADRALAGNPFKTFGEFLLSVARADSGAGQDERLLPLKSRDPVDENGFNIAGAMGPEFVGSLYGGRSYMRALKAASGLSEASVPSAGFLVGSDRPEAILSRVYEIGSVLQRVSMTQVSANSNSLIMHAEDETSRANGYRRGGIQAYWAAEAGTVTASYPAFRDIELRLKKLMALVYATDELLADASALEGWILRNLPEELRFKAEDAILNGTGAGMPLGILNSGALISVAKETGQAADTLVAENVIKMLARLWAPSRRNAVWLISQDLEPQLCQMHLSAGTGGQLVYMPPGGLSGAMYGSLFGRPVLPVEYCNKLGDAGDIYLLDLSQYQMIEKGGIESASSIHVKFINGESTFRFTYRLDGQPLWNSALTPYNAGASVGPYISLDAR